MAARTEIWYSAQCSIGMVSRVQEGVADYSFLMHYRGVR
jgi:hypothetical protein